MPRDNSHQQDIRQFRTTADIDRGIAKLRRRIADVEALKADGVFWTHARVSNVQDEISNTVREIFGEDSPQFSRHGHFRIDDGPVRRMRYGEHSKQHHQALQATFVRRIPDAIARLEGLISHLEEKRDELAEPASASRAAFEGRSLNTAIASAAREPVSIWSVGAASKTLVSLVKARSGMDLDGSALMQTVFSPKRPVLAFNAAADQSDLDEQQGMMYLFTGAVMAIRNPAAHRVAVTETPGRALQYLDLLSLLADRLDETNKIG